MEIRQAISMYLTAKAYNDTEFKVKFENPNKNLDECVLFIQAKMLEKVTEEQKKGGAACVIPSDDEIFALAEQYYIDEDLKIDGDTFNNVRMVSMAATSFTDEEKTKMRQEAIEKYQNDVIAEAKKRDAERKAKAKAAKEKKPAQPVLVPDTKENGEEPKKEEPKKGECVQMDMFSDF
jgi:hypothetical protein